MRVFRAAYGEMYERDFRSQVGRNYNVMMGQTPEYGYTPGRVPPLDSSSYGGSLPNSNSKSLVISSKNDSRNSRSTQ